MSLTLGDLLSNSRSLKGTSGVNRPGGRNKEIAELIASKATKHDGASIYWGRLDDVHTELITGPGYPINRGTKEWRQRYDHYLRLGITGAEAELLADLDILVKNLRIRARRDPEFPISGIRSEPRVYNNQYYYLIYFTPR